MDERENFLSGEMSFLQEYFVYFKKSSRSQADKFAAQTPTVICSVLTQGKSTRNQTLSSLRRNTYGSVTDAFDPPPGGERSIYIQLGWIVPRRYQFVKDYFFAALLLFLRFSVNIQVQRV